MKKKLPALSRRPSALQKTAIAGIRKKGAGVAGEAVKRVIEGGDGDDGDGEDDPDIAAAQELLASLSSFEPEHVWWVLANRDQEQAQAAELGIDDAKKKAESKTFNVSHYLRQRYVYAAFRDEVWDRWAQDWISTKALSNAEAHQMPVDPKSEKGDRLDAFKVLREDPVARRVHNERFIPGMKDEVVTIDKVDWLNTWIQPSVKPSKGTAKPILDHILYLCNGNTEYAAHITNWLAYAYQNPGKKINHALLVISEQQGVGKDTMALAMSRLLGEENCPFIEDDAISDGRNEFMKRAQLVVVPEIMCGDRRDVANKMKPLITQATTRINEKNVKPYFTPNLANIVMFSNHENAAYIEDKDRRHFVIICKEAPRDEAYYDTLYEYIEGDGIAGFAWFLQNRDLSSFNPKANAPDTEHKDTVRNATKAGWEAWLEDAWQSDAAPFDRRVVNVREVLSAAVDAKAPRMNTQQITQFLRKKGGGDLDRVRLTGGARVRLWATRDFDKYDADRAMAAEAYESPRKHLCRHLRAVAAE